MSVELRPDEAALWAKVKWSKVILEAVWYAAIALLGWWWTDTWVLAGLAAGYLLSDHVIVPLLRHRTRR